VSAQSSSPSSLHTGGDRYRRWSNTCVHGTNRPPGGGGIYSSCPWARTTNYISLFNSCVRRSHMQAWGPAGHKHVLHIAGAWIHLLPTPTHLMTSSTRSLLAL
jgi:hypothetical protein